MRVVVTGASGNVGSAVVEALGAHSQVSSILGLCRRPHQWRPPRTEWHWGDVAKDDLAPLLEGADVVIHLAWLFHPMRRPEVTWRSNVIGTSRVLEAVAAAGVPALVVASSVGAYSARRDLEPVNESWPTEGVPDAAYSREKAYVERLLDVHEHTHPGRRVVRLRPGFTFHERAATQQRRLFLGPFVPKSLVRPGRVPLLPLPVDLRLQAVETRDVAAAYVSAATGSATGAFNIAAEPILGPPELAELLHARWHPVPAGLLRGATRVAHGAHLLPTAPGLFDLLMQVPMMSVDRARTELGWAPTFDGAAAVRAFLLAGSGEDELSTPPLAHATSGPLRLHEVATGLGERG
jgi:UDP-glucose 4-epimerase